jgi:membrane protein implicated in regulation of membrane protease activity
MAVSPDMIRRSMGVAFLTAAVGMLVLGQTVLQSHLKDWTFVIYWLACFTFTVLAAMTALIDVMIVRRKSREQQRELIEEMVAKIERTQSTDENSPPGRAGQSE